MPCREHIEHSTDGIMHSLCCIWKSIVYFMPDDHAVNSDSAVHRYHEISSQVHWIANIVQGVEGSRWHHEERFPFGNIRMECGYTGLWRQHCTFAFFVIQAAAAFSPLVGFWILTAVLVLLTFVEISWSPPERRSPAFHSHQRRHYRLSPQLRWDATNQQPADQ